MHRARGRDASLDDGHRAIAPTPMDVDRSSNARRRALAHGLQKLPSCIRIATPPDRAISTDTHALVRTCAGSWRYSSRCSAVRGSRPRSQLASTCTARWPRPRRCWRSDALSARATCALGPAVAIGLLERPARNDVNNASTRERRIPRVVRCAGLAVSAHARARAVALAIARAHAAATAVPRLVPAIARVVAVRVVRRARFTGARTIGARPHSIAIAVRRAPPGTCGVDRLVVMVIDVVALRLVGRQLGGISAGIRRAAGRECDDGDEKNRLSHAAGRCNVCARTCDLSGISLAREKTTRRSRDARRVMASERRRVVQCAAPTRGRSCTTQPITCAGVENGVPARWHSH